MSFNNDISDLIHLAKEENESYRFDNSDEYKEIYNRVDDKSRIVDYIEEELGCPIEVILKAITEGIYVYDVNSNCRKVIKEEPTFILDKDIINEKKGFGFVITGRYIYLKDYKKTWWLKEDKSE